jgi:hypothetical protein
MDKLMSTAKTPEMAMPCPAMPSVTLRSEAIGVSKLTGMNSEAINAKTHSVIAKTALQWAGCISPLCPTRALPAGTPMA